MKNYTRYNGKRHKRKFSINLHFIPYHIKGKFKVKFKTYKGMKHKGIKIFLILLAVIIGGMFEYSQYFKSHFLMGTTIEGMDCSFLTVEQAFNDVSGTLDSKQIKFIFSDSTYELYAKELGIGLADEQELISILENQNEILRETKTYSLQNSIQYDPEKVEEYLQELPELQVENMIKPQNAYIKVQKDGTLAIEKEVLGNEINFSNAVSFCISTLASGETTIDFNLITHSQPNITSNNTELNQTLDSVNKILSTVIQYTFEDGSVYTLDKEILVSWVAIDESGKYYVDFSNIETFVREKLEARVRETMNSFMFTPTGLSKEIVLPGSIVLTVDIESEIKLIQEELLSSGTYIRRPIYSLEYLESYVEIDIARQHVWLYSNGECIYDSPCVTGNASTGDDTPTGVFYIIGKYQDFTLTGYNNDGSRYRSFVNFWMPLKNGNGVGLHDASWQPTFGGNWYITHGSHGCINLPYEAAQIIYNNINFNMPVIIYQS